MGNVKNIIIRSMNECDCKKFTKAFKEQGWDKAYELFKDYYNEQEDRHRKVVVAEVNGDVAGYATLLPYAKHGPICR